MNLNVRQLIPFCFTVAALFAGLFSILKSAAGEYLVASQFIMLSMILDGLDGNLARWLKGTSAFGAEMDTFVDFVSFGVAPAVLVYQHSLNGSGLWGMLMVCGIVLSGAMRLARFRIIDPYRGQQGYTGLPITVCAGWLTLSVFVVESGVLDSEFFSLGSGPFAVLVWTGAVAMLILQISLFRYMKPTKELIVFAPSVALVLLLFVKVHVAVSAALAMCAYGFVYAFVTPFLPKHGVIVEEVEEEEPATIGHS